MWPVGYSVLSTPAGLLLLLLLLLAAETASDRPIRQPERTEFGEPFFLVVLTLIQITDSKKRETGSFIKGGGKKKNPVFLFSLFPECVSDNLGGRMSGKDSGSCRFCKWICVQFLVFRLCHLWREIVITFF
ncbi:hypothetical protein SEVIR_9G078300v4 [Setaria viridis]|uniref:Uncharacterized protein n=2 Tax=Setaria TaxID=4554 RepID=A0A368SE98_SETIT|nr:hypothetical protein SETIT_9G079900v2 [Setaria italica]TKV91195.1 hypothetical protein SEVIR_9G078300v2 [Setaria viridis]